MFDMKNIADRRRVLLVLGVILVCASIPTFLVVSTQLAGALLPSVLVGVALYFIFFGKKKEHVENEETV